jgi:hypothetical protein
MPKPASMQPRKTYNILIGELYAGNPPDLHDSLDSSARRKIQKLQEYCQKNPAKIPKVGCLRDTATWLLHTAAQTLPQALSSQQHGAALHL